jgi:hypothetical protein
MSTQVHYFTKTDAPHLPVLDLAGKHHRDGCETCKAHAADPAKTTQKSAHIVSSDLTEQRMYVKAILPTLSDEVPEGLQLGQGHNFLSKDTVVAGIVISNSEVGAGAVRVEPMVFKTRCTNLMIIGQARTKAGAWAIVCELMKGESHVR